MQVIEGKEAQFARAFENVKKVLTAAGATFDDVAEGTPTTSKGMERHVERVPRGGQQDGRQMGAGMKARQPGS